MTSILKQRADAAMPGGVNSPVRAFRSVDGDPIFARRAEGAFLETVDGRRLTDFCLSFGPLILGHAHPVIVDAIRDAALRGTSYAVTTEAEIEMAEWIRNAIPSMECVRLVSSGTEATMTAVRLARGFTGRSRILKFSGCYHGHADCMLVKAGSGVAGIASASSAGVPEAFAHETLVAPYNDFEGAAKVARENASQLAAIIVEPVAGNMGLVLPKTGYLAHLRRIADEIGALLIFDEVITGFRFTFGGYQKVCGVRPDLTCLGKIIGGGLPIGALGGRAEIMEYLAPLGPVYQAGTLSGNPISVAAGLATLKTLKAENPYAVLEQRTQMLASRLAKANHKAGLPIQVPHIGSLFTVFFSPEPVTSFEETGRANTDMFKRWFHLLLENNIYWPPSAFETAFISTAHDEKLLQQTTDVFDKILVSLREHTNR